MFAERDACIISCGMVAIGSRDLLAVLQSTVVHRQLSTMYLDCMVLLKMTCVGSIYRKKGKYYLLIKLFLSKFYLHGA